MRWGGNCRTVVAILPHQCDSCGTWTWLEKIWKESRLVWRCIPCDTRKMLEREEKQARERERDNAMLGAQQRMTTAYPSWYPWITSDQTSVPT